MGHEKGFGQHFCVPLWSLAIVKHFFFFFLLYNQMGCGVSCHICCFSSVCDSVFSFCYNIVVRVGFCWLEHQMKKKGERKKHPGGLANRFNMLVFF